MLTGSSHEGGSSRWVVRAQTAMIARHVCFHWPSLLERRRSSVTGLAICVALASGADVSRDNADVCLLGSQLSRLPWAIELARETMQTVRRNLFWTLAYNAIGLALAMTGRLHPAVAAGAMLLSSLWVIGNSLRLSLAEFPAESAAADALRLEPQADETTVAAAPPATQGAWP